MMDEPFKIVGGAAGPLDREPRKGVTYRIDWAEYWRAFCEEHGEPVPFEGRLLFADGWTYSSSDHAGPEWPPPEDGGRLLFMRRSYWQQRRHMVRTELEGLRDQAENLARLQESKGLPLRGSISYSSGNGIVVEKVQGPQKFADRAIWLKGDLARCEVELAGINRSGKLMG